MQGSEQPASSAMQSLSLSDKTEREKHRESPNSLNELIKELHVIFSSDRVDVDYVKHLMSEFKSVKKEWKKFAKFDPHRYTRNLVDSGNGKFNLMILCWNESQGSSIHSHANSHCFLKVMQGSVKEEMYDWPENSERVAEIEEEVGLKMIPRETMIHESEAVTYINDSIGLHRVENPSHTEPAVTLHLYSPPFDTCDTFDQRTGRRRPATVTFYSMKGKRTPFAPPSVEKLQEQAEDN
ncbi:cysteine dioxygenase type 1-like isoform X1 [Liolophura sinensis]|uniref:cysteine dioxygenase type 1-like isoform X1 n=1 Tax=Liolophura sinensis TaxID=3198878 RepID=UPI0031593351